MIVPDDSTNELGAVINAENSEEGTSEWDHSPLVDIKYVRFPYSSGPDPIGNLSAAGSTVTTGFIALIIGLAILAAVIVIVIILKKKKAN